MIYNIYIKALGLKLIQSGKPILDQIGDVNFINNEYYITADIQREEIKDRKGNTVIEFRYIVEKYKFTLPKCLTDDRMESIRRLYEFAVGNTIEVCRREYSNAWCTTTPCPATWWSHDDWRTTNNFILEDLFKSSLRVAHSLAAPIKDQVQYYDLICLSMLRISTNIGIKKYFMNEILKYTPDEKLRDETVEDLYFLINAEKAKTNYKITDAILPHIINPEITCVCYSLLINKYHNYRISDFSIDGDIIRCSIEGNDFCGYPSYSVITASVIFRGVNDYVLTSEEASAPQIALCKDLDKWNRYDLIYISCGDRFQVKAQSMEIIEYHQQTEEIDE